MRKVIADVVTIIKSLYPYFAKDADLTVTAKAWDLALKDIPDDQISFGFKEAVKVCKVPPTPADVLEQIEKYKAAMNASSAELWSQLVTAFHMADRLVFKLPFKQTLPNGMRECDYAKEQIKDLFRSLPKELQLYCGGLNEFIRLSYCNLEYEKPRFMKEIQNIIEHKNLRERIEERKRLNS